MTSDSAYGPQDAGLYVLVSLLRVHQIGADPEQIRHRFGGAPIGTPADATSCVPLTGLMTGSDLLSCLLEDGSEKRFPVLDHDLEVDGLAVFLAQTRA